MKKTASGLAVALLLSASALALGACGGSSNPPKEPESAPLSPDSESSKSDGAKGDGAKAEGADAETKSDGASGDSASSASPGKTMKETLGTITRIEVTAGGKPTAELKKLDDIDAALKAIGTDQVPSGDLRKCPDEWVVVFKDATEAEKGHMGLCKGDTLGAEFWSGKGERKGITVENEAKLKAALKLDAKPHKGGGKGGGGKGGGGKGGGKKPKK